MIALLVSAALAAPAGWNVTDATADSGTCELSLGPAETDGVIPMRAECVWKDVTLDQFKTKMSAWDHHDDYFTTVVESTIKTAGDKALVYQMHRSSGISDREVMITMWHEVVDGFERYAWNTATAEPLTVIKGNVRCARSEGYWQAKAEPTGGIRVVHLLSYDPGGSVPGFLVRWFQTSGLGTNATELHQSLRDGTVF